MSYFPATSLGSLTPATARQLCDLVRQVSGISIRPSNRAFLELRLGRRVRELELSSYAQYVELLAGPRAQAEASHLVEVMATHTTSFFREQPHYDWLMRTGLPTLFSAGAGREYPLSVWSAACSTGAELWSAGMVLDQFGKSVPGGLRYQLFGTDISNRILRRAERATYQAEEIQELGESYRRAYLMKSRKPLGEVAGKRVYRIIPELRQKATFAFANLTRGGPEIELVADVVFLRNVLIYFEKAAVNAALSTVRSRMRPGGFLFTGHAEKMMGGDLGFTQIGPAIYRKD